MDEPNGHGTAVGGPTDPDDDFVCRRYAVWYSSFDCAYRTRYRTSPGCLACDQGRFNLARHLPDLLRRESRRRCTSRG